MSALTPSQLAALARSTGLEPAEIEATYGGRRTQSISQVSSAAYALGVPAPLDSSPISPPPSRYAAAARGQLAPRVVPPGYGSGPAFAAAMGGPSSRDLRVPAHPPAPKLAPPTSPFPPLPKLPGLPGGPDPFSSTVPVPPAPVPGAFATLRPSSGPDPLSVLRPRWPRGGGA